MIFTHQSEALRGLFVHMNLRPHNKARGGHQEEVIAVTITTTFINSGDTITVCVSGRIMNSRTHKRDVMREWVKTENTGQWGPGYKSVAFSWEKTWNGSHFGSRHFSLCLHCALAMLWQQTVYSLLYCAALVENLHKSTEAENNVCYFYSWLFVLRLCISESSLCP